MIRITSVNRCRTADFDNIYLIVRSIESLKRSRNSILNSAIQVSDLAPSKSLFYRHLDWNKAGCWNKNKFETEYAPTFLNELNNNQNAKIWLNKIAADDKAGKKIALLCFCKDEDLCHRTIVGEILKQKGCNIVFDKDVYTK